MMVFLMHRDHDFDMHRKLPSNEQALTQDLDLNTLFTAMSLGDTFLFEVARQAVLSGVSDLDTILYRQSILKDSLKNRSIINAIYNIATEAIEGEKKVYSGIFGAYPDAILNRSMKVMHLFAGSLKKLKEIADEHAGAFESEGFTAFFAMLGKELGDEYFAAIQDHLRDLEFRDGVLISAELGAGNKGAHYTLHRAQDKKQSWMKRISARKAPVHTMTISDRDESGARALSELKGKGINLVADTFAQSTDHILGFFKMLRTELAFYVCCLNLHQQLDQKGEPLSFPLPAVRGERRHSFRGLYDVCLALRVKQRIVGNDMFADDKDLVVITGANQGGKSTFLRSIGLSQLMMQCGMFAPAESFCSNVCDALFTHYKREEDATMNSGKLDEELARMSGVADTITANSMLLFNESFAATNEREGSEIARQITCALLERRVKVFFVTHLYEFAHGLYDKKMKNAIFLRAERQTDGGRTFRVREGEPLQTSHGEDLYCRIFGTIPRAASATPSDKNMDASTQVTRGYE